MFIDNLVQFHHTVFLYLFNFSHSFPEMIFFIAQKLDGYLVVIAIILGIWNVYSRYREWSFQCIRHLFQDGKTAILSVISAWGISYFLKQIFGIPRPFLRFSEITPLFEHGGFDSFPSGHATLFMAMGVMIFLRNKPIGIIFIIGAILISLARVASGVHFPIDILAGWCIGALTVLIINYSITRTR